MGTVNPPQPPPLEWKDYYTVMAHFYRGEIGRIMIWRQRLDVTTNWSVVAVTGNITYGLGHAEGTHLIFLFAAFLVLLLLIIEARRYRYYDAFRARVRMLEAHLLMPVVMQDPAMLQGDWRRTLAEDLLIPTFKISRMGSIFRRFRRNYCWIFLVLSAAWTVKIWVHCPGSHSWTGFFQAASASQPLAPPLFWSATALLYAALAWFAVGSAFLQAYSGEFETRVMRGKKWSL